MIEVETCDSRDDTTAVDDTERIERMGNRNKEKDYFRPTPFGMK